MGSLYFFNLTHWWVGPFFYCCPLVSVHLYVYMSGCTFTVCILCSVSVGFPLCCVSCKHFWFCFDLWHRVLIWHECHCMFLLFLLKIHKMFLSFFPGQHISPHVKVMLCVHFTPDSTMGSHETLKEFCPSLVSVQEGATTWGRDGRRHHGLLLVAGLGAGCSIVVWNTRHDLKSPGGKIQKNSL